MVGMAGFEPTTSASRTQRSTKLSYIPSGMQRIPARVAFARTVYVQPYFPEPETIPNSVAAEPYEVRLRFVRTVVMLHLVSAAAVASTVIWAWKRELTVTTWPGALALLLVLSLFRKFRPAFDFAITLLALPPFLFMLGLQLHLTNDEGFPVYGLGLSLVAATVYTVLAGRDFSFVGCYMLAGGSTVLTMLVANHWLGLPPLGLAAGIILALAYLFYFVYDLASLLSRRRLGEPLLAVSDLYRDVLNILTYSIRVLHHWRTFRI